MVGPWGLDLQYSFLCLSYGFSSRYVTVSVGHFQQRSKWEQVPWRVMPRILQAVFILCADSVAKLEIPTEGSGEDVFFFMPLLYGLEMDDTRLPKYDFVFIIALQYVFAQGFEIAFQDLPTTAGPTRSGQGTGTMPKGSKNSSTALRTPG